MSEDYVYISYSRHDHPFVDRLSDDLRNAGIQVWRDVATIQPGTNWAEKRPEGVMQATALLYVSSSNAAGSRWMELELREFLERQGRVIPLIIDDAGAEHIPVELYRRQWVDFRGDYQSALDRVLKGLRELRHVGPVEAPQQISKGYVFISYAEEDADFVGKLKEYLKDRKYGYWDFQESDRDYHEDYYLELEEVIRDAAGTLSILSPDWKQSRTAFREYHFSEEVGTPVFLLKAREPGPTLTIAGVPYIDFTHNLKTGFGKLDKALKLKGL